MAEARARAPGVRVWVSVVRDGADQSGIDCELRRASWIGTSKFIGPESNVATNPSSGFLAETWAQGGRRIHPVHLDRSRSVGQVVGPGDGDVLGNRHYQDTSGMRSCL